MTLSQLVSRRKPAPCKPASCGPAAGAHAVHAPDRGDRLVGGRYRLGQLLGRGSEADVYQAVDVGSDLEAAVKIFRTDTADAASPFAREQALHAQLQHDNIVRISGHGRVMADGGLGSGRNYVVAELVRGSDLRTVLRDKTLSALQVTAWMSDTASALAYIHRRGIVHNDVKPANILVDRANLPNSLGLAKLTDFGIATSARHRPKSATSGTPHYLSPEAVHGTATSSASDVYALGLVTFECLTGIKAFPGPALESMVARTLRAPRLPDTVRRRWSVLLHAMTDKEPANRPTAVEVRRALLRIHR